MGKDLLGIAVTTRDTMTHVLGLAKAAKRIGIRADIFLTGEGVHIVQDRRFKELLQVARVGICEVSYLKRGYKKDDIPGLSDKDFVTQARNAEIIDKSDRYISL